MCTRLVDNYLLITSNLRFTHRHVLACFFLSLVNFNFVSCGFDEFGKSPKWQKSYSIASLITTFAPRLTKIVRPHAIAKTAIDSGLYHLRCCFLFLYDRQRPCLGRAIHNYQPIGWKIIFWKITFPGSVHQLCFVPHSGVCFCRYGCLKQRGGGKIGQKKCTLSYEYGQQNSHVLWWQG